MLKVAILGVGGISEAHYWAWEDIQDAELVALCDIRPKQMEKYPNKNKYTSFEEMLENESIDILDICLPTYLHVEYAIKAMEKGIHVICEKPISLFPEEAEKAYKISKKTGCYFMIAQVVRFWDEYEYIKQVFESKEYGNLLSGSMSRLGSYPAWSWDNWMSDEKRSGLVPFDLHIHDLDFIVYAFGTPKNANKCRSKLKDQDYLNATYSYDNFFINIDASWYKSPYPFKLYFRFQFENAVIEFENNTLKVYQKDKEIFYPFGNGNNDLGDSGIPKSNAYANEINYFFECVKNKKEITKVQEESVLTVLNLLND